MSGRPPDPEGSSIAARAVKIGLLMFVLVLGAVEIAAMLSDDEPLPFQYEGFD